MKKTNILVAGIGGVGGYFGGMLAKRYQHDVSVNINFMARGPHLAEIKKNGLRLIHACKEHIARPHIVSDDPSDLGPADLILLCCKSYDLEGLLVALQTCIDEHTILLPLLNGVDHRAALLSHYPQNLVLEGIAYIVSHLKQPGLVENMGNIQKLYFGLNDCCDERLENYEKIFQTAGIDAHHDQNISPVLWEKFIFLSPIATATTYYDLCIGALIADKEIMATLCILIEEVVMLAKAKNIIIPDDIQNRSIEKLKSLPYETTSSMHRDFQQKRHLTEIQSLTGYVITEAIKLKIETPTYLKLYSKLSLI